MAVPYSSFLPRGANVAPGQIRGAKSGRLYPLPTMKATFNGPADPEALRYMNRIAVRYAGGPKQARVGDFPELERRQGSQNVPAGVGQFRITVTGDALRKVVEEEAQPDFEFVADAMTTYAKTISPVDTASYQNGVTFFTEELVLGTERGAGISLTGKTRALRIVGTVMFRDDGSQERDPRVYALFVEFGGGATPAYAVLRRTVDWGAPILVRRLRQRFGEFAIRSPEIRRPMVT